MPERIGFVGVGQIGASMARPLKDVGYPVTTVYDIDQKLVSRPVRLGRMECLKECASSRLPISSYALAPVVQTAPLFLMRTPYRGRDRASAQNFDDKSALNPSPDQIVWPPGIW